MKYDFSWLPLQHSAGVWLASNIRIIAFPCCCRVMIILSYSLMAFSLGLNFLDGMRFDLSDNFS
jgi:hypothetical protein